MPDQNIDQNIDALEALTAIGLNPMTEVPEPPPFMQATPQQFALVTRPYLAAKVGHDMMRLLLAAPNNSTLRSLFTAKCGVPLTDELLALPHPELLDRLEELVAAFVPPHPPAPRPGVTFDGLFRRTAIGRCRCAEPETARATLEVTHDDLEELLDAAEQGEDFDDLLVDLLDKKLEVEVEGGDLDFEGQGADYTDHEMSDTDDHSSEIRNRRAVVENIIAEIRAHFPGRAEELGI